MLTNIVECDKMVCIMLNIFDWIVGGFVNWKTTTISIVTAIFIFLKGAGYLEISDADQATIIAGLVIVFGWFAKDSNSSGTPTNRN